MKEKILGILNFREPTDPKSKSLIFQYAIYTPQEEMKQVIALRPDLRLQILRRAFGVEEYKQAMENAKIARDMSRAADGEELKNLHRALEITCDVCHSLYLKE